MAAETEKRHIVNVYHGMTGGSLSRSYTECEMWWNSDLKKRFGTLDENLARQIEGNTDSGEVTVLDLGSGTGNLFRSFLKTFVPPTTMETVRLLERNPDLRVRMVGLTDAPSEDMFLRSETIEPFNRGELSVNPALERISAENTYYTITRTQTLGDFLRAKGIGSVNLAFATNSLVYLDAGNFRGVLQEMINALAPKGRFVGVNYAGHAPQFSTDYPFKLPIRRIDPGKLDMKEFFHLKGGVFTQCPDIDVLTIIGKLQDVMAKLVRLGVLEPNPALYLDRHALQPVEVNRQIEYIARFVTDSNQQHMREALERITTPLLEDAERKLFKKNADKDYAQKREVLEELREKEKDRADIYFDDGKIIVEKK